MRTALVITGLVLCLAGGAFVHHLVQDRGVPLKASRTAAGGGSSQVQALSSVRERSAASLADELKNLTRDPRDPHWGEVEALLVSLSPAEALAILRDREQQDKDFWSSNGGWFAKDLLRRAARDPQALLSFVESTRDARWYELSASFCFDAEPDAVLESIRRFEFPPESSSPELERNTLYRYAMTTACERDPARALAIAARHGLMENGMDQPDYGVARELTTAVSRWAERSPAAAMAFAEKYPSRLPAAFESWGRDDPDAAEAWLRAHPERREQVFKDPVPEGKDPMEDLRLQYISRRPDDAARFAERVSDPEEYQRWFSWGMAKKPLEECTAWLRSLPEEQRREAGNTILHMGGMDEAECLAICQAFPEMAGNSGAASPIEDWSRREPEAVARFLESPSVPESARFRFLPEAMKGWARADPESAQRYLQSLPDSEAKGAMLIDASQIIWEGGRDAARDCALSLPDVSLRIGACRRILEQGGFISNGSDFEEQIKARTQWIEAIPDASVRAALKAKP
jgi:hypothetical protein